MTTLTVDHQKPQKGSFLACEKSVFLVNFDIFGFLALFGIFGLEGHFEACFLFGHGILWSSMTRNDENAILAQNRHF